MSSSSIVIASIARTPIAKFCGSYSSLKGSELAAIAIRGALAKLPTTANDVHISEAIMGNVVSAGMGQAPTRQAVLFAGLPETTICTTINKVCASGMKSVMLASQCLQLNAPAASPGSAMLAGGFESMSRVPHYLPNSRSGTSLGNASLIDGVIHDGLWYVIVADIYICI
jgi:acetyl-CoA C-acetyltransferase